MSIMAARHERNQDILGRDERKDRITAELAEARRNERITARFSKTTLPAGTTLSQARAHGEALAKAEYKTLHDMIMQSGIRNPFGLLGTVLEEGYGPQEVQAILTQRTDSAAHVEAQALTDGCINQRTARKATNLAEIASRVYGTLNGGAEKKLSTADFTRSAFGANFDEDEEDGASWQNLFEQQ